jgi:hypothetical protein
MLMVEEVTRGLEAVRTKDDAVALKAGKQAATAWILVVHGNAGHSRPIEMLLEGAGYEVVSAGEVDEARTLLNYARPDLVIVTEGQVEALAAQLASYTGTMVVTVTDDYPEIEVQDSNLHWSVNALLENVSRVLASPAFDSNGQGQ